MIASLIRSLFAPKRYLVRIEHKTKFLGPKGIKYAERTWLKHRTFSSLEKAQHVAKFNRFDNPDEVRTADLFDLKGEHAGFPWGPHPWGDSQ